jgi:hypothetical protein
MGFSGLSWKYLEVNAKPFVNHGFPVVSNEKIKVKFALLGAAILII